MRIRWNLKVKLNNKGNTLAIVIIGIFILSILGTLILSLTATNYKMKLVDKKSEATFYYAEKALDEVYAAIGTEVMTCAKEAYESVLENHVTSSGVLIQKLTPADAEDLFKTLYIEGEHTTRGIAISDGIKTLYPDSDPDVIINRLNSGSVITPVAGYQSRLIELTGATQTEVEYVYDDPMSPDKQLQEILLKNICVECVTDTTGYYSSVITDIKIKIPSITMAITERVDGFDYDEIFKYSIIAQGQGNSAITDASIVVEKNATISGNVYAGARAYNDSTGHTISGNSVQINSRTLNVKSHNFVCEGAFVLDSANAVFRNLSNNSSFSDDINALQLYVKDLILEGTAPSGVSSNLDIVGNCIIADDLEVNGNNYSVNIQGNYYGYGYQEKSEAEFGIEADSGVMPTFDSSGDVAVKEHEKRSAIIVNGQNADIDMTGVRYMILGGRAYIDLNEGGQYGDASYMTGESISFKGNQQVYLANMVGNPKDYASLRADMLSAGYNVGNLEVGLYSYLGLDASSVVAKKTNDKVYFYNREADPVQQTRYFNDNFNVNLDAMQEHIQLGLGVQNLKFGSQLSAYTVGYMMAVEAGWLKGIGAGSYGAGGGISESQFFNLVKHIRVRQSYLVHTLEDISKTENATLTLKMNDGTIGAASTETMNPYEFIMNTMIVPEFTGTKQDTNLQMTSGAIQSQLASMGYASSTNVGYFISDEQSDTAEKEINFDAGIVITNGNVKVSQNFTGIIISKGTVNIFGECEINASVDLVKTMFEEITELHALLQMNQSGSSTDDTIIDGNGMDYKQLVEKSNWRKNIN